MSNISGNTFFIENSVNCSDLGSLNGQVTFIDCSINCGQVLNAIFSGVAGVNTPYNYGQVYGCTIFSDSYNYGYVCGTGILRGTSRLYGGADCVILCDQSTIDPSAEVTDYELLVNYSTPVNCYSLDSCYYTYSNGVATLATGGWSNGFYCNGDRQTVLQYIGNQFYPCAIQGADTLAWYTYNQYLGGNGVQCADGNYYNASISSENLNQISSPFIYPIIDWFADCIYGPRGCGYVIYESGLSIGELNGIYATSGCPLPELKRLNCNEFNSCWFSNVTETIAMHQPFPFLIENSNQIYSCGNEYVLIDSSFNCIVNCTGTYSIGVFGETTSNCYCIYYWCASCGYSVLKLNETIQTPRPAINDNAYYTYCTGVPSLASGLYSNFAINGGVIDTTYCNYAPNNESQDGCCLPFIYTDGCAYSAVDCDTIFENCVFYSSSSEVANESFKNFYTDPTYFGVLNSQQRGIYSNFTAYPTFCLNYLFSYKCLGNMCDSAIIYCGNGQFVFVCSSFPFFEHKIQRNNIDIATPINLCNSQTNQYYFIVCGGSTSFATGAYSNYYFNNDGTILASACTTPQEAQDCTGLYYEYTSIGCACGAFGAYSNYYFDPFYSIDTSYSCAVPLQVAKDSSCYFLYLCGSAIIGNGAYSNYIFSNGDVDINYTCLTPRCAVDNGYYYIYTSGIAAVATNGAYSIGYISEQYINTYVNCPTPLEIIDCQGFYYSFCAGCPIVANGLYSNGAFSTSQLCVDYSCSEPQTVQDVNCSYFVFISGVASYAPCGPYTNAYLNDCHCICENYSTIYPQKALNCDKYYTYTNGIANNLNGPYCCYYLCNSFIINGDFCVPSLPIDVCTALMCDNTFNIYVPFQVTPYKIYLTGIAVNANGFYSNGYFADGIYTFPPQFGAKQAQNNNLYYCYYNNANYPGVSLADGPYSIGWFCYGSFWEYGGGMTTAIDDGCKYVYSAGVVQYQVAAAGTDCGFICYNIVNTCYGICAGGSVGQCGNQFYIGEYYCCADGNNNCGEAYRSYCGCYVYYATYDPETCQYDSCTTTYVP